LAGEVRELAAHAAIAQIELQLAVRRLAEAKLLTGDIERRVKAGDAARVDLLQSQSSAQLAAGVQTQATSALKRAQAQWLALTGLSEVSVLDETVGVAQDHPAVTAADAQLRAAQARLELTQKDRSDPMELSLGVIRERAALGSASETRMQVAVRIPFGGDSRNAPRVAAANADVDAAQADALAAVRTVQAERSAATSDLAAARLAETLAADRARLSTEAQGLLANAYRLGESDLPTRLRADNERFDAELSHARARVETRRAIAKLNQAFGVQP
jgi:cobalt-zinc-cadmium efflux system outer membrane protein